MLSQVAAGALNFFASDFLNLGTTDNAEKFSKQPCEKSLGRGDCRWSVRYLSLFPALSQKGRGSYRNRSVPSLVLTLNTLFDTTVQFLERSANRIVYKMF